jgi:hypothetical protein
MATLLPEAPTTTLYETDFYEWALRTATLIREGRFAELDQEHAAEEIEALARSDYRQLSRRSDILIAHLLMGRYQRAKMTRSWQLTIVNQRLAIAKVLRDSPSLRRMLPSIAGQSWHDGIQLAMAETGLEREALPASCPFTLEEIYGADILAL